METYVIRWEQANSTELLCTQLNSLSESLAELISFLAICALIFNIILGIYMQLCVDNVDHIAMIWKLKCNEYFKHAHE